jgi:hypothetical protein
MRNGRLYAGTLGQGVFVSDNLGDSWAAYNQGLVGGFANAQLYIKELLIRGDSLYAATSGAGPWVRRFSSGTWGRFGDVLESSQASNMNGIAAGGSRLLASAGFNGTVFFRDPGQSDWTLSWLDNVGIVAGLGAMTAIWNGNAWIVGTNVGVFTSPLGQSPWTFHDIGLGTLFNVTFTPRGRVVFACFGYGGGSNFSTSTNDGADWETFDDLPGIFTYTIARAGDVLYAARFDGLWRRSVANVSVPPDLPLGLRFAIVRGQPVRDVVRFAVTLPEAGAARLEIFDVAGRRVATPLDESLPAGPSEISWSAAALAPGVYHARLCTERASATARIVRVR